MKHAIPLEAYGPQAEEMVGAIESCVHCGFCLPTCPTYVELEEEMDSPRGRIFLIKETLEGKIELETALPYVDNCLGCQACETACPSGVRYGELLTPFRAYAEEHRERQLIDRLTRMLALQTLPYPRRLRLAALAGQALRPLARALPPSLGASLRLLPAELPKPQPLPAFHSAAGRPRARVGLLAGCAQQVLAPEIGWATLRVLARNGIETVVPPAQGCCGSLAMHTGAAAQARRLARDNLSAFPEDVDAIVTNTAGCGSGMKEYATLFKGDPDHRRAAELAAKVVDVSVLLDDLGLVEVPPLGRELTVAYHDACHLTHAQKARAEPRSLLSAIPGLKLVTPIEWELCCGSAGTYNIERPQIANRLGERKARNLLATNAELIVAGNIGCLTQIQAHLRKLGHVVPTMHTIELLDRAYAQTLAPLRPARMREPTG
ncbi:MAG: 4Fe-4S dicluster domain-containing protein [Acidobacteriota bacterium]|nr:4Fe-4S dicluster domain-containing protein [Acidobacteriota bacterium]